MNLSALPVSTKVLAGVGGTVAAAGVGISASTVTSTSYPPLSFNNTSELGSFNGGPCAAAYLDPKQQEHLRQEGVWGDDWAKWADKFKNNTGSNPRGCLTLSWDKETWNDGHWKGIIRYEWLFTKGNEAILVDGFYASSYTDEDPETQKQDGAKNNWKAVYINGTAKAIAHGSGSVNLNKVWLMWQKSKSIESLLLAKPKLLENNEWSFDKDKKCDSAKCSGNPKTKEHREFRWRWQKGGDRTFKDWNDGFDTVFAFLYDGGNKSVESLKNIINSEKGTWQRI